METALVVPKSARGLRFEQLPITRRLGNVIRTAGFQTLGHLHGQTLFDLLQRRSCGWRTVIEVQRLIARAVSGEFDIACIEAKALHAADDQFLRVIGVNRVEPDVTSARVEQPRRMKPAADEVQVVKHLCRDADGAGWTHILPDESFARPRSIR